MNAAREEIFRRIRTALPGIAEDAAEAHARLPRTYLRSSALDHGEVLALLIDRLVDYDAHVVQLANEDEIRAALERVLADNGEAQVVVAKDFPAAWQPAGVEVVIDAELPIAALEHVPAVVTTCEAAAAATGTIFLVHTGAQGRRAITLLPDHHICLVRRDQVVELVPEALARVEAQSRLPITTISGPSATADIEMIRIRGVHGPRRLTVLLYG